MALRRPRVGRCRPSVLSGESKPWNERRIPDDMHRRGPWLAGQPAAGGSAATVTPRPSLGWTERRPPRGVEWRVSCGTVESRTMGIGTVWLMAPPLLELGPS